MSLLAGYSGWSSMSAVCSGEGCGGRLEGLQRRGLMWGEIGFAATRADMGGDWVCNGELGGCGGRLFYAECKPRVYGPRPNEEPSSGAP